MVFAIPVVVLLIVVAVVIAMKAKGGSAPTSPTVEDRGPSLDERLEQHTHVSAAPTESSRHAHPQPEPEAAPLVFEADEAPTGGTEPPVAPDAPEPMVKARIQPAADAPEPMVKARVQPGRPARDEPAVRDDEHDDEVPASRLRVPGQRAVVKGPAPAPVAQPEPVPEVPVADELVVEELLVEEPVLVDDVEVEPVADMAPVAVEVEPITEDLADPEPTVAVDVDPAAELQPEPEPEPTQERSDADPLDHEPAAPGLLDLTPTPDAVAEAHAGFAPASATGEVAELPTEPALVAEPLPDASPDASVPADATTDVDLVEAAPRLQLVAEPELDPVDHVLKALIDRAQTRQVGIAEVAAELVEQANLEDRDIDEVLADLVERVDEDEDQVDSSARLEELTFFNDAVPRRPGQLTDFDRLEAQAKKKVIIRVLCLLVAMQEDNRLKPSEPRSEAETRHWPLARAVWPVPVGAADAEAQAAEEEADADLDDKKMPNRRLLRAKR